MNTKKINTKALIILLAVFAFSASFAQQIEKKVIVETKPKHMKFMQGSELPIPNLTDKQKEDIKKIHIETKSAIMKLHAQIEVKEAQINALKLEDNYDLKKIDQLIDEKVKLKADIAKKHVRAEQDIKKLLDDEQKMAFNMIIKHKGKKPFHKHPHHPGVKFEYKKAFIKEKDF